MKRLFLHQMGGQVRYADRHHATGAMMFYGNIEAGISMPIQLISYHFSLGETRAERS
ncbi:hypothetical protein MASR2M39_31660 [Ignavibacteriales bacterium]